MSTITETPKFTHDCSNCKFLGTFENHDLYFCETPGEDTVIGRYGNKGWEYTSGMVFARPDGTKVLYEAKQRAIKMGFLK